MSTIHYINECRILKVDNLDPKEEGHFPPKPKSAETVLKERQEKGYTYRSNICTVCYVARSRSGNCSCTE